MTLDEAIAYFSELAIKQKKRADRIKNRPVYACDFYGEEKENREKSARNKKLAEWLMELKEYRDRIEDDWK